MEQTVENVITLFNPLIKQLGTFWVVLVIDQSSEDTPEKEKFN